MTARIDHAIVMGGTSGIGRAAAIELARAGARVSVVGRSEERGAAVVEAIERAGGQARFIAADLREERSAEIAVNEAVKAFGLLDAAVNAAADIPGDANRRLHELDDAAFDAQLVPELRVCLGPLRAELSHAVSREARPLSIVNVSSINGLGAAPRAPFYSAIKAAQIALTKSAALDYAADGVRVNAVVLGVFDTPLLERVHDHIVGGSLEARAAMREQLLGFVPLGRIGKPEEAATLLAWLCSPASSYVTGASWIVDGGMTAFAR